MNGLQNIWSRVLQRPLLFLFLIALIPKIYCSRDTYLHEWDERYHALVAKNLIEHPLKPTLYDTPAEPYDFRDWTRNHIWLSKPPLPLWMMAGSIALFGTHEYAVRVPGILFAVMSVMLTWGIALRFVTPAYAFIAAAMHAVHGMLTDLASGRLSSDGVECVFLFFTLLGVWFIVRRPPGMARIGDYALTGVATGLAVISKWQPAFLVLILLFVYHFRARQLWSHILLCSVAFVISACLWLPWVMYILYAFPTEATWMLQALISPFADQSLNPDGTWYSYLTDFGNLFGYSAYIILLIIGSRLFRQPLAPRAFLFVWAVLPLLVFSFAEVKRGTYLFISAPGVFIAVAIALQSLGSSWNQFRWVPRALGVVSIISVLGYSIEKLYLFNPKSSTRSWSDQIKGSVYLPGQVVYNEPHPIEAMFYHDITAYDFPQYVPSSHSLP